VPLDALPLAELRARRAFPHPSAECSLRRVQANPRDHHDLRGQNPRRPIVVPGWLKPVRLVRPVEMDSTNPWGSASGVADTKTACLVPQFRFTWVRNSSKKDRFLADKLPDARLALGSAVGRPKKTCPCGHPGTG